jgi:hypothetical protein
MHHLDRIRFGVADLAVWGLVGLGGWLHQLRGLDWATIISLAGGFFGAIAVLINSIRQPRLRKLENLVERRDEQLEEVRDELATARSERDKYQAEAQQAAFQVQTLAAIKQIRTDAAAADGATPEEPK